MSRAGRNAASTRRGQPLVMLAVLLSAWTGARISMWEAPWPTLESVQDFAVPSLAAREPPRSAARLDPSERGDLETAQEQPLPWAGDAMQPGQAAPPLPWAEPAAPPLRGRARAAAGHQLLWMAAMSYLPVPGELDRRLTQVAPPGGASPILPAGAPPTVDRWSLDSWALWREGSGSALAGQGRLPTYGASQAGAVLRYRLAPGSAHDPQAYVRAYRALISGGESELATGLSARPIGQIPLRAHAEMRVTRFTDGTRPRPAAFVTSELPVVRMPARLRAEAYFQAGYVAGRGATGFADGQVHVLHDVPGIDLGELSLGAAAWGGAQEGAQRLDLGPSARLDLTIGKAPARVSLDYRERVAGDAEPPSGVAVTLSTRF